MYLLCTIILMEASKVLPFYQLLLPVSWKLPPFSCTVCREHFSHQVAGFLFEYELLRASTQIWLLYLLLLGGSSATQGASAGPRETEHPSSFC